MARTKITARKSKGGKQPRKQLVSTQDLNITPSEIFEPPASPNQNKKKTQRQHKKQKNQKKQQKNEYQKRQKIQERRIKQPNYSEIYSAYVDGTSVLGDLGEGWEFEVPPKLLRENRELEGPELNVPGKKGPKFTKKCSLLDDCGICQRKFRDLTKYRNHMPYHYRDAEGGGCYYCMFCVHAGRKLIDCIFVTEASLIQHLLVYEFIPIGLMALGKEQEKEELLTKPQNTADMQRKLAKVMRLAYKMPKNIKFQVSFLRKVKILS